MPDSGVGGKGGVSRRKLLARGAVAAGVVWAAPVIRTTTAYAATSDGTERPATRFFVVAIDASNQAWPVFPDGQASLPPTWKPESVGNGWPKPWDGEGDPPWAQTSAKPTGGRVYTYEMPAALVAGPGRSVALADADEGTEREPVLDDTTVAADDPEMPDSEQFAHRIGADLPDPLPPPVVDWVYANPGIELEGPDRRPALSQVGDAAWACVLPAPPALPDWWSRRYRLVLGCYKDGNYFGADGYEDPNPPSAELGRRVIFPTRIDRAGGYIGASGRPGLAGPDQVDRGGTASTRAGGAPGSAVRAAESGDPEEPLEPTEPSDPEVPTSGSSSTSSTTTTTTRPGGEPVWDPATCKPDPKAPFPWNLKYPDNFLVAWFGPRWGIKIPPPPKSACLPPQPEKPSKPDGPHTSNSSSSTTTTTTPGSDEDERTTTADTTAPTAATDPTAPAAPPAPAAAAQQPSSAIRHEKPRNRTSRKVRYSHNGHLGDHECIVLIYCRP